MTATRPKKTIYAQLSVLIFLALSATNSFLPAGRAYADQLNINCAPAGVNLPESAPPQLVAVLSIDCATMLANKDNSSRLSLAWDYGYPSLLWGHYPPEEVMKGLESIAAEGDHAFFRSDANIQRLVLESEASDELKAFVFASTAPADTPPIDMDVDLWAVALPIWNDRQASAILEKICGSGQCAAAPTICSRQVGLPDKRAVAKGAISITDLVAKCSMTFEWLRALRRAGVLDTSCTSALHLNQAINNGANPVTACSADQIASEGATVSTSADVIRSLRRTLLVNPRSRISQTQQAELHMYFPEISDFYAGMPE